MRILRWESEKKEKKLIQKDKEDNVMPLDQTLKPSPEPSLQSVQTIEMEEQTRRVQ
ncbi:hypothetical protein BY996DRAFT_6457182 [Phakopsora pachyrhizi]|uniref:Uncharacterized protein n=1 Tax=Phakopsora pachyrhizi TaxID=170000 RepID=A0AAV0AJU3_PHAPC|nr:hypothetical protein BY996DRAFT_6457182 [Phakopsora pachyrhizi]CAH7668308.1 hypothetical protein PPACK8108_LOCUS2794 [Phakopsora pachyrhizi]